MHPFISNQHAINISYVHPNGSMATRAFIAVDLPMGAEDSLRPAMEELSRLGVRPVGRDNMHITLLFLGNVQEQEMPKIIKAMEQIKTKSFLCRITGMGTLPEGRPRVIFCRIEEGASELEAINRELASRIRESGIKLEDRRLLPHLTIARCTPQTDFAQLREFIGKEKGPGLEFQCSEIKLKSSLLSSTGAVHKDIFVRSLEQA
jgi:2'-5' RNA ligase